GRGWHLGGGDRAAILVDQNEVGECPARIDAQDGAHRARLGKPRRSTGTASPPASSPSAIGTVTLKLQQAQAVVFAPAAVAISARSSATGRRHKGRGRGGVRRSPVGPMQILRGRS